jgi:IS5 family transposase
MVEEIPGWQRVTLGADKGYDRKELVKQMREHRVTPHFARKHTQYHRPAHHSACGVRHQSV